MSKRKASSKFLMSAFLLALVLHSCRKDDVVVAPLNSGSVACADRSFTINVDSIFNSTGFVEWPICDCDTLNFELTNMVPGGSLLEWTVFDTLVGPTVITGINDLTLVAPDLGTIMTIVFLDDMSFIQAIFILFKEDDCI